MYLQICSEGRPKGVGWGRGDDGDVLLAHRVNEVGLARVERDASVWVAARGTVLQVTLDRHTDVRELAANLVMTTCEELNLKEGIPVGGRDDGVAKFGFLGIAARSVIGITAVGLLVAGKPVGEVFAEAFDVARARNRIDVLNQILATYDSPIGLVNVAICKHAIQSLKGFAGLGKDDNACRRSVQSVGNAHKNIPGLLVAVLDESFQSLGNRLIAGLVALHYLVTGLRHGDDVIVFVYNLHLRRLHVHTAVNLDNLTADV